MLIDPPLGGDVGPSPPPAACRLLRNDDDGLAGDGVELAHLVARAARDAFALVQVVRLGPRARDRFCRTDLDAHLAPRAPAGDDAERDQLAADSRRTACVDDMREERAREALQ